MNVSLTRWLLDLHANDLLEVVVVFSFILVVIPLLVVRRSEAFQPMSPSWLEPPGCFILVFPGSITFKRFLQY